MAPGQKKREGRATKGNPGDLISKKSGHRKSVFLGERTISTNKRITSKKGRPTLFAEKSERDTEKEGTSS